MIVFGCAVTDLETYETYAHAGVLRHGEPDSELLAHQSTGSLLRNYNLLLDEAQKRDNLATRLVKVLGRNVTASATPKAGARLQSCLRAAARSTSE